MRRLALLPTALAFGLAALAWGADEPPGSEFVGTDSPKVFAFPSNGKWDVEGPAKTKVVQVVHEPNRASSDPRERQGTALIWSRKCTAARQKVVFARDVFLAGPEYELAASIGLLRDGDATFKSARMTVNGHRVLKVGPAGGSFERTTERPRVFRFGHNHVEVSVVKGPNHTGKPCNRDVRPGYATGVLFNLYGELAADVALPPQVKEEYRRLDEGAFGVGIPLSFEVRNDGPGGLARVPLYVRIEVPVTGEPHGTLLQVSDPQSPVHSCKATPPAGEVHDAPRTVACTIANLRPGETARQNMRVSFLMPSGSSRAVVYIRWSAFVEEPDGADGTNNERYKTIWICKHDDESCPASR